MSLSADGIYWAASTFAQSAVALLAFGGFLAISRMDKVLQVAMRDPVQHLTHRIIRCASAGVAFKDPDRGRDLINLAEYLRRVVGEPPVVETRDPAANVQTCVEAAQHYLAQRSRVETDFQAGRLEVIGDAAGSDDPFGFTMLERDLKAILPLARLLSRINFWLKATSIAGLIGFAYAMLLVGNAEFVVAMPRPLGFFVVSLFALAVIATTVSATMLARWCFAPVVDEPSG